MISRMWRNTHKHTHTHTHTKICSRHCKNRIHIYNHIHTQNSSRALAGILRRHADEGTHTVTHTSKDEQTYAHNIRTTIHIHTTYTLIHTSEEVPFQDLANPSCPRSVALIASPRGAAT